jgi:hypothetical protein
VLWITGGRRVETAELAEVSLPTVDRWVDWYGADGVAGPMDRSHAGAS